MPYAADDVVKGLRDARAYFLKHVRGMTEQQWNFKPYPECKSPAETVAHLIADDRCALDCIRTGGAPDYAAYDEPVTDPDTLLGRLAETHEHLCAHIVAEYGSAPPDTEVCIYGEKGKLGSLLVLASEDYYHAGQVAYVRMATDPQWDYYTTVYG